MMNEYKWSYISWTSLLNGEDPNLPYLELCGHVSSFEYLLRGEHVKKGSPSEVVEYLHKIKQE